MASALAIQRATRRLMAAADALRRLAVGRPSDAPSNCAAWALQQQQRYGGAVILTDSLYGPWLHAQWRDQDGHVWEFVPLVPKVAGGAMPTLFEGQPVEVASASPAVTDSCRVMGVFYVGFTR